MSKAPLYPVFLSLAQRPVLIVGGGQVAVRKARGLLDAGARVTVVSPAFDGDFSRLRKIRKIRSAYAVKHLRARPWSLVFAATSVGMVNARVRKDAAAARILCCRCDSPEHSDFASPAATRLGGV